MLFFAGSGASALAEPPDTPFLTGTNPASPSTFSQPSIQGEAEGEVIATVVGPMMAAAGPIAMATENPQFDIVIYAGDSTCSESEAIVAEGDAGELEGVGIMVDEAVESGVTTTFYAEQVDPVTEEVSECSKGLPYRHVAGAPLAPVLTSVTPASPANDNAPRLRGEADPDATVSIHTDSTCLSPALATGTGAAFEAPGIQVSVPDNSSTTFYAKALLAGFSSGCSVSSLAYQELTPPSEEPPGGGPEDEEGVGGGDQPPAAPEQPKVPDVPGKPSPPQLKTTPEGAANNNTPLISGKAPGAAFVKVYGSEGCKGPVLVKGTAGDLAAGIAVQVVDDAVLTFYGISVDGGGDSSACSPEPAIYVEDSTAPKTKITGGPGVKTRKRTAVFRFTDLTGGLGTSFVCKLDRRKWRQCQAPLRLKRLGRRRHVVRVKAFDAAGNQERAAAKRRFKVVR